MLPNSCYRVWSVLDLQFCISLFWPKYERNFSGFLSHNSDEDHGGYKDWQETSLRSKLKKDCNCRTEKIKWYVQLCWYFDLQDAVICTTMLIFWTSNNASIQVWNYLFDACNIILAWNNYLLAKKIVSFRSWVRLAQ